VRIKEQNSQMRLRGRAERLRWRPSAGFFYRKAKGVSHTLTYKPGGPTTLAITTEVGRHKERTGEDKIRGTFTIRASMIILVLFRCVYRRVNDGVGVRLK